MLIKGDTFINFFIFCFLIFFNFFSLWLCKENQIICYCEGGLRLFKGLSLLYLPNVQGAMFIQGGTSISESRVPRDDGLMGEGEQAPQFLADQLTLFQPGAGLSPPHYN